LFVCSINNFVITYISINIGKIFLLANKKPGN
jgi:hypothetical protein